MMGGLGFAETELRLGLPGKRAFSETIDLKLQLHTAPSAAAESTKSTAIAAAVDSVEKPQQCMLDSSSTDVAAAAADPEKPRAPKAQAVGWPPVRSYRKNILAEKGKAGEAEEKQSNSSTAAAMVKVSMDGAPYLRKVDLKLYKSYRELSAALVKMFGSFAGEGGGSSSISSSDFVPTYEDKDGDWMLVGDVPWQMFVESCKRMRIMKGSEAIGLAPRNGESTCKNKI